eukprot:3983059-Pleurochrysis_carterae.AAC.1
MGLASAVAVASAELSAASLRISASGACKDAEIYEGRMRSACAGDARHPNAELDGPRCKGLRERGGGAWSGEARARRWNGS